MGGTTKRGPRRPETVTRNIVRGVVVVAVCALLIAVGTGAAVADVGNEGRSCPGENPNVGYDNANEHGALSSLQGISEAFVRNDCPSG